jgi:hypothetical protein
MSTGIGGKKREATGFTEQEKYVGVFTATVLAINPTEEQFKSLLDIELKEDSKATNYLSENKDGNTVLRVDVWMKDSKFEKPFKKSFFLEDRERENKDGSKKQYINSVGSCSWAEDESELPKWFAERDYRQAYVGEEKLYNFLKTWLGALDFRDPDTTFQLDWKKLMKGNVKELKEQLDGEYTQKVLGVATIKTVEKTNDETGEQEIKEYQDIYDDFLPEYTSKFFTAVDYDNPKTIKVLESKQSKTLKTHERFVVNIHGEYGCKNFFNLKEMKIYNSGDNIAASSDAVLASDDDDY